MLQKKLNIKAVICISELVPKIKVDAIKALGAKVAIVGKNQEEATYNALQMEKEEGMRYISAFDDPLIIAGQATTALEILEQNPNTTTILAPVSGGGLMSGVAFAAKALKPDIQIIGVTNNSEPAIYSSIKAGKIVQVGETESLADALPGPISHNNQYTFKMCERYVDDILLISEEQIAQAMAFSLLKEKQVLEGGGAATMALLLKDEYVQNFGENTVAICSGNSVAMDTLLKITSTHKKFINQNF
ncbi:pyridoxal-phosphate dependent enzyme [Polaribacter cellanae]|uniref:Pyridoxal-phosphate dependent enzyme n=1 Tax=Polaribacter cellanae TaxID=2818493 RepID=A0A975H5E2_9FLAO|nr:pyridoxal-phosphate dependent enzyme [Polaribacter cellanae]QTE21302.1 pyridoxal-phosphate dependent enzyme [Polaribacter cellanae]